LTLVERGIFAAAREQFVVRAAFDDASLFEHADEIGVAHGGDAVRDDETRALAHHAAQLREDFLFRVSVNAGKRVV
jgi:hypothetical protein